MYEYLKLSDLVKDDEAIPDEFMDERWWYTDYPNFYVSDYGRVFNAKTRHFLKVKKLDNHGHLGVCINVGGKAYYEYIHRLIAKAFVSNQFNAPIVRHLDDDPSNNDPVNLSWGTQKDNYLDSVRNGTHRPFSEEARLKSIECLRRSVRVTNIHTGKIKIYRSINDACRAVGVQQSNAWKVLNGQRPHTLGYLFEYWEE